MLGFIHKVFFFLQRTESSADVFPKQTDQIESEVYQNFTLLQELDHLLRDIL